jgi:hypothetical protein
MENLEAGFAVFPFWMRFIGIIALLCIIAGLGYGNYLARRTAGETALAAIVGILGDAIFGVVKMFTAIFTKPTT